MITVNIVAQVETVDDPDNILGGAANIGDTITGTYTCNPATTDSNASPTVGDYRHNNNNGTVRALIPEGNKELQDLFERQGFQCSPIVNFDKTIEVT